MEVTVKFTHKELRIIQEGMQLGFIHGRTKDPITKDYIALMQKINSMVKLSELTGTKSK